MEDVEVLEAGQECAEAPNAFVQGQPVRGLPEGFDEPGGRWREGVPARTRWCR